MTSDVSGAESRSRPARGRAARGGLNDRLNWLRAGVLGANDGIVSTAGVVVGVAGATTDRAAILIAGVAALVAGAMSMAAGEYVSVSTQRDSELALLDKERRELRDDPAGRARRARRAVRRQGASTRSSRCEVARAARRPTTHWARTPRPSSASTPTTSPARGTRRCASMVAFTVGALLPLLTITLVAESARVWVTVAAVAVALALTGFTSARLGYGPAGRAVLRNVVGGLLAMAVTYLVGTLIGPHV